MGGGSEVSPVALAIVMTFVMIILQAKTNCVVCDNSNRVAPGRYNSN